MDVTEQAPLLRRAERRPAPELERAPDVVQERGGGEEVAAQAWMELGGLATERRNPDGVLEQPARIAVVAVRPGGGKRARSAATDIVAEDLGDDRGEAVVADLAREEVEEAVELLRVAAHRRRQLGRIAVRRGLDRAHLHLEPAAEPLHASEHADGVALGEPAVEQLDVVPDARLDPPARVDELEGEIGRSVLRPPALLAADGEHALDGAILRELGNAGHAGSLGGRRYARAMADVAPFRAIRYAHPSPAVTAPPYDVLTPEALADYRSRDAHNVVHLTLNDSEDEAGRLFRTWLDEGVLVQDDEPAVWAVAQDYVGPDGIARRREGLVASLRVEPYATGTVLPHERTHAGPKEGRLAPPARRAGAARADLPPLRRRAACGRSRPRAGSRRR